jgi:hypothetical protein
MAPAKLTPLERLDKLVEQTLTSLEQKAAAGEPIPAGELARLRAVIERQEADAERS